MILAEKPLGSGKQLCVYPLTFGRARLCLYEQGKPWIEDEW